MKNLQILAVEDENVYQANIRNLARTLDFNLTDIASTSHTAIESFKNQKPDLVLIDLHLESRKDGLLLADELQKLNQDIPIIFTTNRSDTEGYDYVKQELHATCLFKPLERDLLKTCIENSFRNLRSQLVENNFDTGFVAPKQHNFFVRIGNKLKRVESRKIEFIEVEEKYCSIFTENREIHVKIALKDFLEKLPDNQFIRIHRNYVVNTDFIQSIQINENMVVLHSKELPFSRTYKDDLMSALNLL